MTNVLTEQNVYARFGPWYEHYAAKHLGLPRNVFDAWVHRADRKYHCVFCGWHGSEEQFPVLRFPYAKRVERHRLIGCPKCREYKGLEPCINEYCTVGEEGIPK